MGTKVSLVNLVAFPRGISDHTLLIDTRNTSSSNNQSMFKFEFGWLHRDVLLIWLQKYGIV
jgi:hypothetical protein